MEGPLRFYFEQKYDFDKNECVDAPSVCKKIGALGKGWSMFVVVKK